MSKALQMMAQDNEDRLVVLAARDKRAKSRARMLTCPACNERNYALRDVRDICDPCLIDLWGAQDVLAGAYEGAKAEGLVAVRLPERWHDLPYPGLDYESADPISREAVFYRKKYDRSENPNGVVQILFSELAASLAKILPCDPGSRGRAEWIIDGSHGFTGDGHRLSSCFLRLPAETLETLRHLWHFIRWQNESAKKIGFDEGRNLLMGLNDGGLTQRAFEDAIKEQTRISRKQMTEAEEGRTRR